MIMSKYHFFPNLIILLTVTTVLSGLIQQMTNWWYFIIFLGKYALTFHANCLLKNRLWHFIQIVSEETICMKCQSQFSNKGKKNILKCCLLRLVPSMLSFKHEHVGGHVSANLAVNLKTLLATPISDYQPIRLQHIMFLFKFTNWMTNSVDPAIWSASTLFAKSGVVVNSRIRVNGVIHVIFFTC